VTKRCA